MIDELQAGRCKIAPQPPDYLIKDISSREDAPIGLCRAGERALERGSSCPRCYEPAQVLLPPPKDAPRPCHIIPVETRIAERLRRDLA